MPTKKTTKITRATFKSFIKKNAENLYVRVDSQFDGMQDMVDNVKDPQFRKAKESLNYNENTLGIEGIWLVGSSRNSFRQYEDSFFIGIEYYNCTGSGVVAIKKIIYSTKKEVVK